jgi:hypothetical protein
MVVAGAPARAALPQGRFAAAPHGDAVHLALRRNGASVALGAVARPGPSWLRREAAWRVGPSHFSLRAISLSAPLTPR